MNGAAGSTAVPFSRPSVLTNARGSVTFCKKMIEARVLCAVKDRRHGEYGNRVQIPDGTAAVSAENPHPAQAAHRQNREGDAGSPFRRKSEDLLELRKRFSTDYG